MTVLIDKFCLTKDQNVKPYRTDGSYKVSHITEAGNNSTVQLVLVTLDHSAVIDIQQAERINVEHGGIIYSVIISEISKIHDDNGKYVITISGLIHDLQHVSYLSVEGHKDTRYDELKRNYYSLKDAFTNVCKERDHIKARLDLELHRPYGEPGHKRYW
jgi:hypothetical protein